MLACGGGSSGTGGSGSYNRLIKGTIINESKKPIQDVKVTIVGTKFSGKSDTKGDFVIKSTEDLGNEITLAFESEKINQSLVLKDIPEDKEVIDFDCTYDEDEEDLEIDEIIYEEYYEYEDDFYDESDFEDEIDDESDFDTEDEDLIEDESNFEDDSDFEDDFVEEDVIDDGSDLDF